uniref:Uncharacterized protein n=1 Tax=Rhizophora mucronata TaxID=61149 RepID=A0A2P2QK33_RHIMU
MGMTIVLASWMTVTYYHLMGTLLRCIPKVDFFMLGRSKYSGKLMLMGRQRNNGVKVRMRMAV